MASRLQTVFNHLKGSDSFLTPNQTAALPSYRKREDDIVIVSALRTPIGKAKRGSFKDTLPDDLLTAVFKGVLAESKINPADIGDICVGNVCDGKAALTARFAQVFSGIPTDVPLYTTNRQCSSGLVAFMNIAANIKSGVYDIGLAAGVESLTKNPMGSGAFIPNPKMSDYQEAQDLLLPMGITSENVAERFGVSREDQDKFSYESQLKAKYASENGLFKDEIVPVTTTIEDKDGQERTITVTKDDGIRKTTLEGLGKLRPAFKEGGSTTAGNSSQVSDGAAAVLVMTRREAVKRGYSILGILRSFAVKGCPPDIMGIGPAVAIPEALKKAGLTSDEIEVYEINEAFASQALYCVQKLNIPIDRVNPKGGAIALGHPLGCTGARQIATLLHELKRRGKRSLGVVSMCIGTGMGAAAVFEYPGSS